MRRIGLCVVCVLIGQSQAWAQNGLTVGAMTLLATIEGIGVRAAYTGDADADATATLEFKRAVDTTWLAAYTPIIDRRATIITTNDNTANQNQARGSIVGLTANTSYNVRVTWTDADGVTGTNPVTGSVSTSPTTPATGGTSYYVNSATGSNGNAGTSSGTAWATIAFALSNTVAGDTINCNGTFAAFTISVSGSSGAFRKLQQESGQSCTISSGTNTLTIAGDYWWIHGLTLNASTTESVVLLSGTRHHIYLTSLTIPNYVTSECASCAFGAGIGGITVTGNDNHDIFILNNTIARTATTCGRQGANAVGFLGNGHYNFVIDSNTITGGAWDAIGNGTNSSLTNLENMDWSRNTITDYYDDAAEMDGAGINLRVWGNVATTNAACSPGGNTGLSEAGTIVGPSYVFRNYFVTNLGVGVKSGHNALGWSFYFHNTIKVTRSGGGYQALTQAGGTAYSTNHVYRNNIFVTTNNNIHEREGARTGNDYDYDLAYCGGCGAAVSLWNNATNYTTWAQFVAATGMEDFGGTLANGLYGDPALDGSYHIGSSSIAKDVGVTLANFNDASSSCVASGVPDVGAYEYGGCAAAPPAPTAPTGHLFRIRP